MSYDQSHQAFLLARAQDARRSIRFTDFDDFALAVKRHAAEGVRYLLLFIGILALAIGLILYWPRRWRGGNAAEQARKIRRKRG